MQTKNTSNAGESREGSRTTQYDNPEIGCYVDASSQSADTCNERAIRFAERYGFTHEPLPSDSDEDYSQILSELGDDVILFLNDLETRSYMFWGFEDNSLFLIADVDEAREDVGFVSRTTIDETTDLDDASHPCADYRGEWLHVSDHGNATLYVRGDDGKDRKVWSVV